MSKKRGKLSKGEMSFIEKNIDNLSIEKIAQALNRTEEPVKKYIFTLSAVKKKDDTHHELSTGLHNKYYWKELKEQFSNEELQYFTSMWVDLVRQFNNDVLPSEEMQIKELIRTEIIINRNMVDRQKIIFEINNLEKEINKLDEKIEDSEPEEAGTYALLKGKAMDTLSMLMNSKNAYIKEHTLLLDKKEKGLKELKASRGDRVKDIISYKEDFGAWLRVLDDEERREREGINLSKMQISTKNEQDRLSGWHQYVDGEVDQPILNEFTVKDIEEYD